jgi:hypothetical protein
LFLATGENKMYNVKIIRIIIILLITIVLGLYLNKCVKNESVEIITYNSEGNGETDYSYNTIIFQNEKNVYLFGDHTIYEDRQESLVVDKESIVVYKSEDSGKNWQLVLTLENLSLGVEMKYPIVIDQTVFLLVYDEHLEKTFRLFSFNMETQKYKISSNIFSVYQGRLNIDADENLIYSNLDSIYYINQDLNIVSSTEIRNKIDGRVISLNDKLYCLSDKKLFDMTTQNYISYPLYFYELISSPQTNSIILIGRKNNDHLCIVEYNILTEQMNLIKELPKYEFVDLFLSNNDAIMFALVQESYIPDNRLLYSLDYGKTWHEKKLKRSSMVFPNYLYKDNFYIFSRHLIANTKIQKIIFNSNFE